MKIRVAVVFGGKSTEHKISIISAVQAMHAMDKEKYEVTPFYTTKQGLLYTGEALLPSLHTRPSVILLENDLTDDLES